MKDTMCVGKYKFNYVTLLGLIWMISLTSGKFYNKHSVLLLFFFLLSSFHFESSSFVIFCPVPICQSKVNKTAVAHPHHFGAKMCSFLRATEKRKNIMFSRSIHIPIYFSSSSSIGLSPKMKMRTVDSLLDYIYSHFIFFALLLAVTKVISEI